MLTENQLDTLRAVCNTVIPSISRQDDEFGITISLGYWLNLAATTLRDRDAVEPRAIAKAAA